MIVFLDMASVNIYEKYEKISKEIESGRFGISGAIGIHREIEDLEKIISDDCFFRYGKCKYLWKIWKN